VRTIAEIMPPKAKKQKVADDVEVKTATLGMQAADARDQTNCPLSSTVDCMPMPLILEPDLQTT
jgi:hypothetical protein